MKRKILVTDFSDDNPFPFRFSLIDIDRCRSSNYEMLMEPASEGELYTRAFQVDDAGKEVLIGIAADVSSTRGCSTCTGNSGDLQRGFRAEIRGIVTALADGDTPATIQLTEAVHSNGLETVCDGVPSVAPPSSMTGDGGGNDNANDVKDEDDDDDTAIVVVSSIAVACVALVALIAMVGGAFKKK